jgi:hypothetical protein
VPKLDTGQRVWNVAGLSTIRGLGGRLAGRQRLWLAGAEVDCRDHLDVILDSISNMGEMASVNTNAALSEGDPPPLVQIAGPFGFYACCAVLLGAMAGTIRLLGPRTNNQQLDTI